MFALLVLLILFLTIYLLMAGIAEHKTKRKFMGDDE